MELLEIFLTEPFLENLSSVKISPELLVIGINLLLLEDMDSEISINVQILKLIDLEN